MASLKHDNQGFLVGEMIDSQRGMLDAQESSLSLLRAIRKDVRFMARAMGARPALPRSVRQAPFGVAAQPAGRSAIRSHSTRAARAVAELVGVAASESGARAARQTVTTRARDSLGRFTSAGAVGRQDLERTAGKAPLLTPTSAAAQEPAGRDGRGRFTGGGAGSPDKAETNIGSKLLDTLGRLDSNLSGAEQIDPMIAAAHEIREVVSPLGRGMFALLNRNAERRKERWYSRIWKALTKRKDERPGGGAGDVGRGSFVGTFMGEMMSKLAPMLSALGPMLMRLFGPVAAAWAGWQLGKVIYEWLDKAGITTKFFDAIDDVRSWFSNKYEAASKTVAEIESDYNKGVEEQTSPENPAEPLPKATSFSQRVGRAVGAVKALFRSKDQQRALQTGSDYAAGNIANLSDEQTRALVASTALTESAGGKLDAVNEAGYIGRYQAGAGWLADAGLIRGGSNAVNAAMDKDGFSNEYKWGLSGGMTRFLKDPKNWTQGMSYDQYMASPEAQDLAFKDNSNAAYRKLLELGPKKGGIDRNTPPQVVAGLLKARHIAGLGGAKSVLSGRAGAADANGTTARKYFEDMVTDRHGFTAAFESPTLFASVKPIAPVVVPSSVPDKLPPPPEVKIPLPLTAAKPQPIIIRQSEAVRQDVSDRSIAHVVRGGIGG